MKCWSNHQRCSVRKCVLRNFAKFALKHLRQSLFLKKDTLAKVFSCEFCEIFKNTLLTEHLWATASELKVAPGDIPWKTWLSTSWVYLHTSFLDRGHTLILPLIEILSTNRGFFTFHTICVTELMTSFFRIFFFLLLSVFPVIRHSVSP